MHKRTWERANGLDNYKKGDDMSDLEKLLKQITDNVIPTIKDQKQFDLKISVYQGSLSPHKGKAIDLLESSFPEFSGILEKKEKEVARDNSDTAADTSDMRD